jgi:hypothetical protein
VVLSSRGAKIFARMGDAIVGRTPISEGLRRNSMHRQESPHKPLPKNSQNAIPEASSCRIKAGFNGIPMATGDWPEVNCDETQGARKNPTYD